jgi:hypothetical protein
MPERVGVDQHPDKLYHVERNGGVVTLASRPVGEARNGMSVQYLSPASARRLATMLNECADELEA